MTILTSNAQVIQEKLKETGFSFMVVELPKSTRTSIEAASAVGCEVGQIAKSIIFKCKKSGNPILVIASGKNRVNENKINQIIGEEVGKADADFVYEKTGYAIGGVPPAFHKTEIKPFLDEDLLNYEEVWAAAGTSNAVFRINPKDLIIISGGEVIKVY